MTPLVVDPSGYLKPHHSVGHCPPSCMPSQRASTNILSDGRCRSSNDCEANPPKHGDGSTLPVSASHNSSLTGTSSLQPNAELWEPYDGRLSRTVLREREVSLSCCQVFLGGLGQGLGLGCLVGGLGFEHGEDDVAAASGDAGHGGVVAFAL